MDKSVNHPQIINEEKILLILQRQEVILSKILSSLQFPSKKFLSKEEAAQFLNVSPDYIYQLVHQRRIRPIKNKGQKKLYFLKEDLENYIMGSSSDDKNYQNFEEDIEREWKKKA